MEILVVAVLLLILLSIVYLFFPHIFKHGQQFRKYWSKGIVPPNLSNSNENIVLIYISMSGLLVGQHPVEVHKKLAFLYKYLLNDENLCQFEDRRNSFFAEVRSSLIYARAHPIQLDSVAKYLQKLDLSEIQKLNFIRFLADFAFIDQQIHPLELRVIESIAEKIGLDKTLVDQVIKPMIETQERRAQQEQESWKNRTTSNYTSPNYKAKHCAVLGIAVTADLKEVKKAYRKLAMEHHPDKYINAEEHIYQAAQQKFIEIQVAYEYLEKQF
jgi:DnaJ-domain-containing protein 1